MEPITEKRINQVLGFLNYFKELTESHPDERIDVTTVASNYPISARIPYIAVRLKYFTKNSNKSYKCNVTKFSPLMARKIIEKEREYLRDIKRNSRAKKNITIESKDKPVSKTVFERIVDNTPEKKITITESDKSKKKEPTTITWNEDDVIWKEYKNKSKATKTPIDINTRTIKFSLFWGLIKYSYHKTSYDN